LIEDGHLEHPMAGAPVREWPSRPSFDPDSVGRSFSEKQ
jgi:hypothetical protein